MSGDRERGEIHLGDLATALTRLRWQNEPDADAIATKIAACLGFGLVTARETNPPTEIYDRQRYRRRVQERPPEPEQPRISVPPMPEPPPALPAESLPSQLTHLPERTPPELDDLEWLKEDNVLFRKEETTAVARRPLFPNRTSRPVISAALATTRTGQMIDVRQILERICRLEVVNELPCETEPTLERGCQLLLDYSSSMVPFWEDLDVLVEQVSNVVGKASQQIFYFDSNPLDANRWTPTGDQVKWQPDGRPVMVATDFGIQGSTGRVKLKPNWTRFVKLCTDRRAPLVILIPWPETRWPLDIGRYPDLMHWSPNTTAAMVGKKIGAGRQSGA